MNLDGRRVFSGSSEACGWLAGWLGILSSAPPDEQASEESSLIPDDIKTPLPPISKTISKSVRTHPPRAHMHLDPEGLARDAPRGRTWRAQQEAPLSRARAPGPDGRCDRAADTRLRAFSLGVSGQSRDPLDCLWTVSGSPLLDRPWTVSGPPLMDRFWTDRLWTASFFFLRFFSIPYAITDKGSVHRTPLFLDRLWTIFGTF